jgi:hypothetical protein
MIVFVCLTMVLMKKVQNDCGTWMGGQFGAIGARQMKRLSGAKVTTTNLKALVKHIIPLE